MIAILSLFHIKMDFALSSSDSKTPVLSYQQDFLHKNPSELTQVQHDLPSPWLWQPLVLPLSTSTSPQAQSRIISLSFLWGMEGGLNN